MKRIILKMCSLILVVCLLFPSAFAAQGDDGGTASPQFTGLLSFGTTLSISASGVASCHASAAVSSGTYTCAITMKLQQSTDKLNWTTIKTWTSSKTAAPVLNKTYTVVSGYYYRLCCVAKVYNSSGTCIGTNTIYSYVESY